MLNTKFTAQSIKNHFYYRKWIYVLIIAAGYFATDLAYTMTQYRPPDERKVDFMLVQAGAADTEAMGALSETLLNEVKNDDPTLEEVEFISMSYSGNSREDMYGVQNYIVKLAVHECDIWILDNKLFVDLYLEGVASPLDGYIESGILDMPDAETSRYYLYESTGETDKNDAFIVPTEGEKHVYAVPASMMPGISEYGFDPEGKCAVVMSYSMNPETSVRVLAKLIEHLSGENK